VGQGATEFRRVEFAAVYKNTFKLGWHKGVTPLPRCSTWRYASTLKGDDSSLEAGIIAPIGAVVIASIEKLTLSAYKTLQRLIKKRIVGSNHN